MLTIKYLCFDNASQLALLNTDFSRLSNNTLFETRENEEFSGIIVRPQVGVFVIDVNAYD
jgi:hypothetical protein